jgi:hypothetical protein
MPNPRADAETAVCKLIAWFKHYKKPTPDKAPSLMPMVSGRDFIGMLAVQVSLQHFVAVVGTGDIAKASSSWWPGWPAAGARAVLSIWRYLVTPSWCDPQFVRASGLRLGPLIRWPV